MPLVLELYWPQPGTAEQPTLVHPEFTATGSVWDDGDNPPLWTRTNGNVTCTIAGVSETTPANDPWSVNFKLDNSTIGNIYTLEARLVVPNTPDLVIQHQHIMIDDINGAKGPLVLADIEEQ